MDSQQFLFSSQTPVIGSIFNDHFDPTKYFDPIIGSFSQGFDGFMFSDASFLDNVLDSGISLPLDADANSRGLDLSLDGNAQACEEENHGQNSGEPNSSGTTSKPKRDRSKTLVSERRRRSRMKEKLYELRSLVPNITKVSFFSILTY